MIQKKNLEIEQIKYNMRREAVLEADQNDETMADRISNRERFKELAKQVITINKKKEELNKLK